MFNALGGNFFHCVFQVQKCGIHLIFWLNLKEQLHIRPDALIQITSKNPNYHKPATRAIIQPKKNEMKKKPKNVYPTPPPPHLFNSKNKTSNLTSKASIFFQHQRLWLF